MDRFLQFFVDIYEEVADLCSDTLGKVIVVFTASVLIVLVVASGYAIATAINSRHLHEGTITGKYHQPFWIENICTPNGKTVICTPIVHPESWNITIEGIDDRHRKNTRTVEVNEGNYSNLKEGQHFKID